MAVPPFPMLRCRHISVGGGLLTPFPRRLFSRLGGFLCRRDFLCRIALPLPTSLFVQPRILHKKKYSNSSSCAKPGDACVPGLSGPQADGGSELKLKSICKVLLLQPSSRPRLPLSGMTFAVVLKVYEGFTRRRFAHQVTANTHFWTGAVDAVGILRGCSLISH